MQIRKLCLTVYVLCVCLCLSVQYSQAKNANQESKECNGLVIDTTSTVPPSSFGVHDVIGAANRLTPKKTLEAVGLVTHGRSYPLGIEISRSVPAFSPRKVDVFVIFAESFRSSANLLTFHDDFLEPGWLGVGSQIDGLSHVCMGDFCYNGLPQGEVWQHDVTASATQGPFAVAPGTRLSEGIEKLGIETVPPFVTRGLVLDMTKVFGKSRLEASSVGADSITCQHIVQALQRQHLRIREGDVVLFHTGWLDVAVSDPATFIAVEPGLTLSAAQYLIHKKILAVGADNWAVEAIPNVIDTGPGGTWPGSVFPVHTLLIPKNGIYILEYINTKILVENDVSEFLFVLGQPRYTGAVQAIINPVAIK